ncbi:MAG: fused MFS/spermidine synthase [Candidatus Goldbacteria bacterium]|nr:fused MFS/spermidine synthase [Candidatus Goldiibacteriota bacterium]
MIKKPDGKIILYINSFIAGAATLIIEIAGTRIMAPFFGTTVFTWSALIGITLLSLAAGYYAGGLYSEKERNYTSVYSVTLLASLLTAFMIIYKNPVLQFADFMGAKAGVIFASAALFTPCLFLFGAVSPLSVKYASSELGAGKSAGYIFAVSTAGSFLGAISAGYWLIPQLGIKTVFIICAVLPALTGFAGLLSLKQSIKTFVMIFFVMCVMLIIHLNVSGAYYGKNAKVLFEKENHFGKIIVFDTKAKTRILMVDGTIQMYYDLVKNEPAAGYINNLEKAAEFGDKKSTALIVGAGAGALTVKLESRGIKTDNIEIDRDIAYIADKFFGNKVKFIIEDGRRYIRKCGKKYDLVFFDVFKGYSICPYMATKEAFQEAKAVLNKGGILSMNMVAEAPKGSIYGESVAAVYSTLSSVFDTVKFDFNAQGDFANYVFYASDSDFYPGNLTEPIPGGVVLTDDKNNMENIYSAVVAKWRDTNRQILGIRFML